MLKLALFHVFFVGLLFAGSSSVNAGQIDPASVKQPDMTPAMNLGKMSFNAKCASCHGISATGSDKGPPLLHKFYQPGHHSDTAFYRASQMGVKAHHWSFGDMPPVEGITQQMVGKILIYVRALQQANGLF